MSTPAETRLAYFNRQAEKAYARCLHDFKARKPEILSEARRRLLVNPEDELWTAPYVDLHQAELDADADKVLHRVMKMRNGWS